jgi:hypothetical protein
MAFGIPSMSRPTGRVSTGLIGPVGSLPFQGSLFPLIYEADRQDAEENYHRPEAKNTDFPERYRPGEKEGDFQVEYDEEDRYQVESDIEFMPGIFKGIKPAFVCRVLLRIRTLALPRRYRLALVLARPVGREDIVTGTGSLQLEGASGGRPAKLALAQVAVDKSAKWGFNYRNMQVIEIDIELPQGFVPERLSIELSPARIGAAGLRQAFLWQPSPL